MSRMKHRSAETGRATEDQSAAKQPKHHIHSKLTTNDTPKKVTTPGAPLSLDPARIWAFARHTSWVEGGGEGGNLDGAYKKGTAPSGVAAIAPETS